jgi:hypothetical protein
LHSNTATDISILHDVVASAQEKLEAAHGPKPLPAAALFKAYDEILPRHGVDPDNDNHLSRLLFRIGGEKGHGTLSDKFQAVLGGMGIVLEFDDNSVRSFAGSNSPQPQVHRTRGEHKFSENFTYHNGASAAPIDIYADKPDATQDAVVEIAADDITDTLPLNDIRAAYPGKSDEQINWTNLAVEKRIKEEQGNGENSMERQPSMSNNALLDTLANVRKTPALKRPSLLSALDRWKTAVGRKIVDSRVTNLVPEPPVPQHHRHELSGTKLPPVPQHNGSSYALAHEDEVAYAPIKQLQRNTLSQQHACATPIPKSHSPSEEYSVLMQRAARARQIYLASRAFNHWADKTATRLEREAIARRHMIRFRCFRGWSQTPGCMTPAVDQLIAITAVQKLHRAVAYQDEQLRAAARAIANNYRLKLAKRALEQWACSAAEDRFRQEDASRARRSVALAWLSQAGKGTNLSKVASQCKKQNVAQMWRDRARDAEERLNISRQVGMVRPAFAHLRAWWDHTEVERRAQIYNANILGTKTLRAFEHWNLSSRAQAFIWHDDYIRVTKAVQVWTKSRNQHERQAARGRNYYEAKKMPLVQDAVVVFSIYQDYLKHYAERARLFIFATRLLRVFDHAYQKSKTQRKQEVRQQLMTRYKEVSALRKRRKFESTLDKWRSLARKSVALKANVEEHKAKNDSRKGQVALYRWSYAAAMNQQTHIDGERRGIYAAIKLWSNYTAYQEQQELQSWNSWIHRKQRQSLKTWSISSLQGSGQAHSAKMVRDRHEVDKRGRAFQVWRQTSRAIESKASLYRARTTPQLNQSFSGRSSWRARASKIDSSYQSSFLGTPMASVETPTRWTGQALPLGGSISYPMPPVEEADEESSKLSHASDDMPEEIEARRHGRVERPFGVRLGSILAGHNTASTTPQAPVPRHLQRERSSYYPGSEEHQIRISHSALPHTARPWQKRPVDVSKSQTHMNLTSSTAYRAPMSDSRPLTTPATNTRACGQTARAGARSAPQYRKDFRNIERQPRQTPNNIGRDNLSRSIIKTRTRFAPSESIDEPNYRNR